MSAARKLQLSPEEFIAEAIQEGVSLVDSCAGNDLPVSSHRKEIVLCDGQKPEEMLRMAIDQGYTQFVQTGSRGFGVELQTSAELAINPESIVNFPVSTILDPKNISPETEEKFTILDTKFSKAKEKHQILDRLEVKVTRLTKSTALKADIIVVADELLTNAIFNAPFVDKTNARSGVPREKANVGMDEGKFGRFFVGADSDRIVVGCTDPYGRLNINRLLERVQSCYETSVAENINMSGTGGAGIGSYMIFNSSTSYFAVVNEDQVTLVCSVLPLKGSSRSRQETPKNLHYIKIEEGK